MKLIRIFVNRALVPAPNASIMHEYHEVQINVRTMRVHHLTPLASTPEQSRAARRVHTASIS